MTQRVAIVSGVRTPFCKASGLLKDLEADDLGAVAVRELFAKILFDAEQIDEVIIGNVLQPSHATNIARVIAVKAGLPDKIPAHTVNRNCASGMEAVVTAANQIRLGQAEIIVAGGVESMSNFPILFPKQMRNLLQALKKAKSWQDKLKLLTQLRPSLFTPQLPGLTDPLCGLSMGQTAEKIIREFHIHRTQQDRFALDSHRKAAAAAQSGRFAEEIIPLALPPHNNSFQQVDDGPRDQQTLEALAKLTPVFEPLTGSVTAGNSSPLTDGAAALLVMSEQKALQLQLQPLGYLKAYASVGLDPSRMGLGPVFATAKLLQQTQLSLDDIDLIEINEAFAGQVLAVLEAFACDSFAQQALKRDKALGSIDPGKLNVNGGAVALGHPLGASGTRLILTLLLELKRQKKKLGLATLCVGGGQGQACLLEVES